jgi:hypothetical protein
MAHDERAHTLMQALMARGAVPEADARELYRHIYKRADGARLPDAVQRC